MEDHLAISLPNAPYSGFQMEGPFSPPALAQMFLQLNDEFSKRNIQTVAIRQRPDFEQSPKINLLHQGLIKNGFEFIKEVNQHVLLNKSIEQNLHSMQIRKINKCKSEGFTFHQEHSEGIQEVYSFLSNCRAQQGLELNIEEQRLIQLFSDLPQYYECYTVRNQRGQIVAATVIVMLNEKIVYNYLPGFNRSCKSFSPLSYLLFNLYNQLTSRKYQIFDLGLSSLNGELQDSLYTYKTRMGAIHLDRFIYKRSTK